MKKIFYLTILLLIANANAFSGTGTGSADIPGKKHHTQINLRVCTPRNSDSQLFALKQLKEKLTTIQLSSSCRLSFKTTGGAAKVQALRGIYSDCYPSQISVKLTYKF